MNVGYNCYDNVNIQKTNLINKIKLCIFVNEAKNRLNHLFWFFLSLERREEKLRLACFCLEALILITDCVQVWELCQVPSSEQGLSWADRKWWVWNLTVSWCQTLLVSSQQEQIVSVWIKHYLFSWSYLDYHQSAPSCAFQISPCLSREALFVLQVLSLHSTEALPLSAGWGRKRRRSRQTFHKSKLWIATFIWFPLQTGVMCAITITGLGTSDYALPLEEALAALALPSEPGSSCPRPALLGKHCRQFVLAAVGTPWAGHNHPGHWCTWASFTPLLCLSSYTSGQMLLLKGNSRECGSWAEQP